MHYCSVLLFLRAIKLETSKKKSYMFLTNSPFQLRALLLKMEMTLSVVRLKKDVWFSKLGNEQITSVETFLKSNDLGFKS